jgi:putative protease
MSSAITGKSGNRGSCSQQCRDRYETTRAGINYPLNLKDNSAYHDLEELADAGVASLKIEGRIKEFEYVFTVVDSWRNQLQRFYNKEKLSTDNSALYHVFNRDFSNGYLKGDINKDMFIDDPGTQSTNYLSKTENGLFDSYARKAVIKEDLEKKISLLSIDKAPISITVSGQNATPLVIRVKTPDKIFKVHSDINLVDRGTAVLTQKMIMKRLKALDSTEYYIKDFDFNNLPEDLYLPFKELGSLKNRLLFLLNGSKESVAPVVNPLIRNTKNPSIRPSIKASLSILISSQDDLNICDHTSSEIYFQLPDGFNRVKSEMIDLFKRRTDLVPWFPSILIEEDYFAAVDFLKKVQPHRIVTNNTGIAYVAWESGIPWIAGPNLNMINSFSLLCLKENFDCIGAFVSNEINQYQIKTIKKPKDFELYFSIYHPIELMTSRQCLSHQVDGCKKSIIDGKCISDCTRNSSIKNMQGKSFVIDKSQDNYHSVYNEHNYLNTKVMSDLSDMFSGYSIDLRNVKTSTEVSVDKIRIVELFESLINGKPESLDDLTANIRGTTCQQYVKGI